MAQGIRDTVHTFKQLSSRRSFLRLLGSSVPALAAAAHLQAQSPSSSTQTALAPTVRAIAHNQLGYHPGLPKVATIVLHPGAPASTIPFRVWTADRRQLAFTSTLTPRQTDALSGDIVSLADFSTISAPGNYQLEVLGSFGDTFRIAPDVYADALQTTMRSYYGQRCGCKVNLGHGYKHGKCHKYGGFDPSSGKSGKVKNTGGWHDAGDYGRYVVNSGVTCGTLLWAWELFPQSLRQLSLHLPESGRGVPDMLAEIRWNLRWMLSMQDPADGGVWHKQTSTHFCAFILPQNDKLPSQIIGTGTAPFKGTCATASFAATVAIAARCFRGIDDAFAAECLASARKAYAWSATNPDIAFKNPPGISTGEYGDETCTDELLWAAAELFRTTREPSFEADFLQAVQRLPGNLQIKSPSWGSVGPLALWTYVLAKADQSTPVTDNIRQATNDAAAALIARATGSGYGHTLAPADYVWGSNSIAANQSLLLLVANRFQSNPAAVRAAMGNLHYLLGRNCFATSWVTQVGVRPFQHPHHRPSAADSILAPWPGLLSGGPNAHGGDKVADALPKAAPMRMWVDDERAYALNEVAINWNAPLVFLLAAANELTSPERGTS